MPSSNRQGPVTPPPGPHLRRATRYEPTRREACLSWWDLPADLPADLDGADDADGPDAEPHHHFALLLDISQTGASVALDEIPDADSEVWLRLEGESVTEWSSANVVGVTSTARGPHLVRLAFQSPCPFETLRAAVCG